jgi:predicted phosphodiesterase
MRVHVVSDVHGNAEALARAGDGADALVVLGDLIDFVDYHDHGSGILGMVFGAEKVSEFARLRRERPAELPAFARALWGSVGDATQVVEDAVRDQYTRLFAAMTTPTYATPGNVDLPDLWPEFAGDQVRMLDGEVAEIGGLRFGFVGGALLPPQVPARRGSGVFRPYLRRAARGRGRDVHARPAGRAGADLRRGGPPVRVRLAFTARPDHETAASVGGVRARAPAAHATHAGRVHRMRQRRALPTHRAALRAALVNLTLG